MNRKGEVLIQLRELLKELGPGFESGSLPSVPVTDVVADSRQVKPGSVFIAIRGLESDGHDYIADAAGKGAVAVVCEAEVNFPGVHCIQVRDSRSVQAILAARFFGNPAAELDMFGITGTNGKTTSSTILQSVLNHCGIETGLLGTITYRWGQKEKSAVRTTPDAIEIHRLLREMANDGVRAVSMEVSSHALELERVQGILFKAAVYTNLSRDHLDFHHTIEDYAHAKAKLFRQIDGGPAVFNRDDPAWQQMANNTTGRIVTFGRESESGFSSNDYRIRDIQESTQGTAFTLLSKSLEHRFFTPLWGLFNVSNTAGVAVVALELGFDPEKIAAGIRAVTRIPGRMDGLASTRGCRVVIDYAHTPDALENVLQSVRAFTPGKMISVFGCGGDRDRGKRPEMGRIGEQLSDVVVITSDNPRTEDPEIIIQDIVKGLRKSQNALVITDRKAAIRKALEMASPKDTVVIAGKGHETYQEINHVRYPFDDREVAESILKEWEN